MARRLLQIVAVAYLGAFCSIGIADEAAFQERIQQLELETTELRNQLDELHKTVGASPKPSTVSYRHDILPGAEAAAIIESLRPEIAAEAKKAAWTKGEFKIVPYGYFWTSMISETSRATPGFLHLVGTFCR